MGPYAPLHLLRGGLRFQPMATGIDLSDLRFGRRSRGRIQMKAKMSKILGFNPELLEKDAKRSGIFRLHRCLTFLHDSWHGCCFLFHSGAL